MKRLLAAAAATLFASAAWAGPTDKIVEADTIVYAGIDYKHAIFYGLEFQEQREKMFPYFVMSWNEMYVSEMLGDLSKILGKKNIKPDMKGMRDRLETCSADEQLDSATGDIEKGHLTDEVIKHAVESYTLEEASGVGFVFVAETFVAAQNKGCVYPTFFDVESREVLWTERVCHEKGGVGMKNAWLTPVRDTTESLKKPYKFWEKQYNAMR